MNIDNQIKKMLGKKKNSSNSFSMGSFPKMNMKPFGMGNSISKSPDMGRVGKHAKDVKRANINKPIFFRKDTKQVIDGGHRVLKARTQNKNVYGIPLTKKDLSTTRLSDKETGSFQIYEDNRGTEYSVNQIKKQYGKRPAQIINPNKIGMRGVWGNVPVASVAQEARGGMNLPNMNMGLPKSKDWDGDGVPNDKDCQPWNTMRQDWMGAAKGNYYKPISARDRRIRKEMIAVMQEKQKTVSRPLVASDLFDAGYKPKHLKIIGGIQNARSRAEVKTTASFSNKFTRDDLITYMQEAQKTKDAPLTKDDYNILSKEEGLPPISQYKKVIGGDFTDAMYASGLYTEEDNLYNREGASEETDIQENTTEELEQMEDTKEEVIDDELGLDDDMDDIPEEEEDK